MTCAIDRRVTVRRLLATPFYGLAIAVYFTSGLIVWLADLISGVYESNRKLRGR